MVDFFLDSWALWVAVAGLAVYQFVSIKVKVVPRLPLLLLILFYVVRIGLCACRAAGWLPSFQHWIDVGSMVILAWAVGRLVLAFTVEFPLRMRGKSLPKITRDLILAILFAVLAVPTIILYGRFNPTGLITTSAVLTAVLGFGAHATLSSFFSGVVLHMEKPFVVGDWIQFDNFTGKVVALSWKSTRLLTRDNELIYMPNSDLLAGRFLNLSKPTPNHRAAFTIGLDYNAPPNNVRSVIMEVLLHHPQAMRDPPPQVWVHDFADSAIVYRVLFHTENIADEDRTIAEIRNELWYALRREGIQIPFPIRDVRHAHEERAHEAAVETARRTQLEAILGTIPILAPLSVTERASLAASVNLFTFGAGETIVREGEEADSMYIIRRGACDVFKESAGRGRSLITLQAGDYFGEMSLLTGEKRAATVKAANDTDLIVINKPLFSQLLLAKPEIAADLADALVVRQQALQSHAAAQQEPATLRTSMRKRIMAYFGLH
jgi:small-conductance mechanosensitive channel/CRP-like cAMP-binding protein